MLLRLRVRDAPFEASGGFRRDASNFARYFETYRPAEHYRAALFPGSRLGNLFDTRDNEGHVAGAARLVSHSAPDEVRWRQVVRRSKRGVREYRKLTNT